MIPRLRQTRRLFVSYRRDDARWFAGRLADSLAAYFGDKRVFRDVDGIAGGADFAAAIHDSLTASDAVIVVIGPQWLAARDAQGRRRLDLADDWVALEVGSALAKGLPVFPVLVEDTPMPRAEELPPALQPLTRFNAVSVSDSRWDDDTARLGRIVSLDIPPVTERRLRAVNLTVCALLVGTMLFMLSVLARQLLQVPPPPDLPGFGGWLALFADHGARACAAPPQMVWPLQNWHTAPVFLATSCGSALMFAFGRHVAPAAKLPYYAAAWVGGGGTFAAFLLYFFACPAHEALVGFFSGMVVAPTMLALMSLSGFRAR
jgi:hypothetical protein